ncbi:Wadjet anti-phage system protein JetA family protein [Lacrimispora indolis]|uniref:Wadjet anti-phage system protein JetA family protein n=1 Tax=Lacrimispora indolis TaxID=69825 RepID=UPI0004163378|nr:Wadjet anti-phage system protein JetA family protein [[Clostridium] methoxybenzovorans]
MEKLFDMIPSGFFNCLSSGSNSGIYSDCLQIIYEQYDREISYRIVRSRIRDAIAAYLLENHVDFIELQEETGARKNYNDLANGIIRKFCSKEIGWLEEDNDDTTYEKHIIMTEQGILLAEFLQNLRRPEREEFSSYIYNIYNVLRNGEQWMQDPYTEGLKNIYRNAKLLSKALKRLATFIKKIIERMFKEESLESLTENIIEYCEGNFIREYARLTKQQNIHIYRSFIRSRLEHMQNDNELFELLVIGCAVEEDLEEETAKDHIMDMIQRTKEFLSEDYDRIMREIKHKINVYLQIAVGRARFLRNREADIRGSVEQTIRYITEEMQTLNWKSEMPVEMSDLFLLDRNEFIDIGSIRFPRKAQTIRKETFANLEEMTEEDIRKAREAHEKEAYSPYSKEKMKIYLENILGEKASISSNRLPMESKRDLLCALSAVAYGEENGYTIQVEEGYVETNGLILHNFEIIKD